MNASQETVGGESGRSKWEQTALQLTVMSSYHRHAYCCFFRLTSVLRPPISHSGFIPPPPHCISLCVSTHVILYSETGYKTTCPHPSTPLQTLQMGIQHFSGLFVLLCIGVGGALLTLAGEHTFYHLVIPRLRRTQSLQYWLHTSQVSTRTLLSGALPSVYRRTAPPSV